MTRTRTLIIIGVFMLCLAVLAALEFRTEDSVLSEGQMVTGSVSKEVAEVLPVEAPPALPVGAPPSTNGTTPGVKGGVLVPLDSGTLRGSSGTTLDMTTTAPNEIPMQNTPPAPVAPRNEPAQPEAAPAVAAAPPVQPAVTRNESVPAPIVEKRVEEKPHVADAEKKQPAPAREKAPVKVTPPVEKAEKASAPAKPKAPAVDKDEVAPLVLTSKAPTTLVGKQKAITQTRLEMGKDISFRVMGAGPLAVKTLLLENPDRYVVDLQGEWGIQLPRVPKNLILKDIRVGQREGATRLVFELHRKPESAEVNKVNAKTVDVRIR